MIKLSLIQPYVSYSIIKPLNFREKGIAAINLMLKQGAPHELDIQINTNLGNAWPFLTQLNDNGLRLQTDLLDISFVKYNQGLEIDENGLGKLKFVSSIWKIKTALPAIPFNYAPLVPSVFNLVSQLSSEIKWFFIGPDIPITFQWGIGDNYELLTKIVKATPGYQFIEAGMVSDGAKMVPQVIFGDMSYLYQLENDPRFKPVTASNYRKITNIFTNDPIITKIKSTNATELYTHLLVWGDSGQGGSANSALFLTDPNASYIDPAFPLDDLDTSYQFIRNTAVSRSYTTILYKAFTLSANSLTAAGIDVTQDNAEGYLYNLAKAYFKTLSQGGDYTFEMSYKQVILPGTKVNVRYSDVNKLNSGQTVQTIGDTTGIHSSFYTNNLSFDLTKVKG